MEKVKFIIRVFYGETNEICYLKTKNGFTTRFLKDAIEFDSLQQAELILNKINLEDNGHTYCDILIYCGGSFWQKARI